MSLVTARTRLGVALIYLAAHLALPAFHAWEHLADHGTHDELAGAEQCEHCALPPGGAQLRCGAPGCQDPRHHHHHGDGSSGSEPCLSCNLSSAPLGLPPACAHSTDHPDGSESCLCLAKSQVPRRLLLGVPTARAPPLVGS